jgi:ABC-2 type transport system permease protein
MFRGLFLFEIKFRLKQISTYVYFALWFSMAFIAVSVRDFGPDGQGGKVFVNSPYNISLLMVWLTTFGLVFMPAIFGMSILRDFEQDTYQFFFTTPIKKRDYLGGRLLGSLVITVLIFSGIIFGLIAGKFMPWADQASLAPINLWFHIQPFLLFSVTQIFVAGAMFFMVGALTRNIVFIYAQGIVFLAALLIFHLLLSIAPDKLAAIADPLGISSFEYVSAYWTISEKNTMTIPFAGVMAWNRLFWLGVGSLATAVTFLCFPFSAETLAAKFARKSSVEDAKEKKTPAFKPSAITVKQRFDSRATLAQLLALTRIHIISIVKEVPFTIIALIGVVVVLIAGSLVGRILNTPVYPVTYLMAGLIKDMSLLFLVVITTFYGGELVWKERGMKYDQIHDALPIPGWLNFASHFVALTIVQIVVIAILTLTGMALQAMQGYFNFELDLYFKELFLIGLPALIQFSIFALFLHTLLPNKFIGHTLVIGIIIIQVAIAEYGFESRLYQIGETPDYTYSDMNGYGHFIKPTLWFTLYWSAFHGVVAVATLMATRRGASLDLRSRLKQAADRFRFPINAVGIAFAMAFVAIGGYIYHNTRRVNKYEDSESGRVIQARYEKQYKKYEGIPQPKITAIDLKVDIFPELRSFAATGVFTLINKTDQLITDLHVLDQNESLKKLSFDRQFKETFADKEIGYYIFQFAEPLKPAESLRMDFNVAYENRGFRDGGDRPEFAYNGTFFDKNYFPVIGYDREFELNDDDERRDQGLGPAPDFPSPEDPKARNRNFFSHDSDWIHFKCVVSSSPDQIAIAPGYLQREWTENGRRYFAYDMGDTKIANFYSFISGRYEVRRDKWKDVSIEVYYDRKHEYNVARMIEATKKGLDYFTTHFGPYQFRQFRILEFPRYREFAQAFPNTIPYSEGLGFIAHGSQEDDLDVPLYVTGHELAHQWWGDQVVGAYAQGSNMLSESLAQYSALMVMEKEVGPSNIRMYLKHELDRYLRGRSEERRKEQPISRVQYEPYVWYHKGSLVMYALKDYIGEERLNAALRKYLDKVKFQEAPYTTSIEFVDAMREATPDELKYIITDLFETITLYDFRAVEVTWKKTPENGYVVKIKVSARKLRADGLGAEKEIQIDELVDIGVFTGAGTNEKALFLEKRRITQPEMEFEITVDQLPGRAGIDPYNKLIDRNPDDNIVFMSGGQLSSSVVTSSALRKY